MTPIDNLQRLLAEIDSLFDSYDPGEAAPDEIVGNIIAKRAAQQPLFDMVIRMTSVGLEKFPFNAELLRRRALARSMIVTPAWSYPDMELADQDFRTVLDVEPNISGSG